MNTDLLTLGTSASLHDARKIMAEHRVRHLLVVDAEQQLAGLVSHRDVLAAAQSSLLPGAASHNDVESGIPLAEVMTSDPKTVDERDSLRGAALYMQQNRIGCLPVVSAGQLVGIITDTYFVAVAIDLMEQMELSDML